MITDFKTSTDLEMEIELSFTKYVHPDGNTIKYDMYRNGNISQMGVHDGYMLSVGFNPDDVNYGCSQEITFSIETHNTTIGESLGMSNESVGKGLCPDVFPPEKIVDFRSSDDREDGMLLTFTETTGSKCNGVRYDLYSVFNGFHLVTEGVLSGDVIDIETCGAPLTYIIRAIDTVTGYYTDSNMDAGQTVCEETPCTPNRSIQRIKKGR